MCKLYAIQTTMTQSYARKKIAEKAKIILRTESHGLGFAINVNGVTRSWQCGESFTDAMGEDVTKDLDGTLKMATLVMHGRTSTSSDRSVNHSHPRRTDFGILMHNGVVRPDSKEGWKMEYDLDTDYLAELASRKELHLAGTYLSGYAGVLHLLDDGTLIVQNQGANLRMRVASEEVEFGTTKELCDGVDFDEMMAEAKDCDIAIHQIDSMSGRKTYYRPETEIGIATHQNMYPSVQRGGRSMIEMGPNPKKKGRLGDESEWDNIIDKEFTKSKRQTTVEEIESAYRNWME